MNKRIALTLSATVLTTALFLSGCASQSSTTPQEEQAPGMTTEKKGDTTLSGKLINLNGKRYLQLQGKPQQEVDSYSVDLSTYEGKNVTITGQFSGDTLFAGKIEEQQ